MKFGVCGLFAPVYSGFADNTACWLGVYLSSLYGPEPIALASGCFASAG